MQLLGAVKQKKKTLCIACDSRSNKLQRGFSESTKRHNMHSISIRALLCPQCSELG